MIGRLSSDSHAQLALLDALVFFTVILALCSSMVAYVGLCEDFGINECEINRVDVSELLSVFLHTSIGTSVVCVSGADIEMTGGESIVDILMVVCDGLMGGLDETFFAPLPSMILEILVQVCPPGFEPHLAILDLMSDPASKVLTLETNPCRDAADISAASQKILDHEGRPFLLVLVLEPALGPHDLCI